MLPLNQQYSHSCPQVKPGLTGWKGPFSASSDVRYSMVGKASQEISPRGWYRSSFRVRIQCFTLSFHSECITFIMSLLYSRKF